MAAEAGQQALAAFGRQRADLSQQRRVRQHREKSQADERCRLESAGGKLPVFRPDCLVKARNALLQLGADAARPGNRRTGAAAGAKQQDGF